MPADGNEQREGPSSRGKGSSRSTKAEQPAQSNGAPATATGTTQLMIDLDFVRGLIEAVDGSTIDTLEINRGGTRIRISKTPTPAAVVTTAGGGVSPAAAAPAATPGTPASAAAAPASAEPEAPRRNLVEVTSPMVGTFYRAPAPEAPPYVEVGSHVTKGQTLCILEAMKLMNELDSEVDGVVREVLVSNADPVEYGQPLFRIEPVGAAA
jgi:acetyl-CoA carboxylase biotin carboxyl carrier protein